jgi:hypothetical protein
VILAQFLAHAPGGAPNAPDAKIVQLPRGFVRNLFCASMCAKPHPTTLRLRSGVVVLAHAPFPTVRQCAVGLSSWLEDEESRFPYRPLPVGLDTGRYIFKSGS